MAEQFVIADPHYSHPTMCVYAGTCGVEPLRPWGRVVPNWKQMTADERADLLPEFEARAAEMDEAMVERWNAVVPAQGAKVYVLGDVAMKAKHLPILGRLNGKKKLLFGNHDILGLKAYAPYFYDMAAYRIGDGIVMSHIPIAEGSLERWRANVHGHLHAERVMRDRCEPVLNTPSARRFDPCAIVRHREIDPRYLCVSVEHTDYAPLPFDEMYRRIEAQQVSA